MSSYREIANQYKNELDTRISIDSYTVKALNKKKQTLLDLQPKKIDSRNKEINAQYEKELNDRIYNDSITVESLNQLYGIQPDDHQFSDVATMYNAFNKLQRTEETSDNINELRTFLKYIEPRDGIVTNIVKSLKGYEIGDILKNQKSYMNLFKKYLGNQSADDIDANSYINIIRDVFPTSDNVIENKDEDVYEEEFNEQEEVNDNDNHLVFLNFINRENHNNDVYKAFCIANKIKYKYKVISNGEIKDKGKTPTSKAEFSVAFNDAFDGDINLFENNFDEWMNQKVAGKGSKSGRGFKKRKIIKGCGLIPQTIVKIKQIGRSFLMLRKLYYDNILSLKYTNNLVSYPNFPNVKVSDELKNIIINCLEKVPPGQDDIINLSRDEKIIYLRVCLLCGLDAKFFDNRRELLSDLKNDFEVGVGELESGNNNEELIYKVKMLGQVLKEANCISHKDLKILQAELVI